jgi:hypothetical protein
MASIHNTLIAFPSCCCGAVNLAVIGNQELRWQTKMRGRNFLFTGCKSARFDFETLPLLGKDECFPGFQLAIHLN